MSDASFSRISGGKESRFGKRDVMAAAAAAAMLDGLANGGNRNGKGEP